MPPFWFGYKSGVHGVLDYTMEMLHVCWRSGSQQAPKSWIKLKNNALSDYWITIDKYVDSEPNKDYPEI